MKRLNAAVATPQTDVYEPALGVPCCPEADATLVEREMPGLNGQLVDRASIHSFSIAPDLQMGEGPTRVEDAPTGTEGL